MAGPGRNSPCPCGSGRKYKHCCGAPAGTANRGAGASGIASGQADPQETVRTGLRYLLGTGLPAEPARGITLIEQAALAGNGEAAWLAATIASSTFWRTRNWDMALDHLLRAAECGHEAARGALCILAAGPRGGNGMDRDWRAMRGAIDLPDWLDPPECRTISDEPCIQVVEKFASPAVCDWLIAQAQDRLTRATIYDRVSGGHTEDGRRTNSQYDLGIETCGVPTFVLRARIGVITGREDQAMEIPKILHYAPGETFAMHFDYLNPEEPSYSAELAQRGQRTHTFLLYLNDEYSGGETQFPDIGLSHAGKKGDALLFRNVDETGEPDKKTMHAGLPPTTGEKWVFSQWIRKPPESK